MFDKDSNISILPRGVVKLPSENPLEETFFFAIRKQMLMFSCLWMELFLLSIFNDSTPIGLEPVFVFLCVLLQSLSVHVCISFLVFLESSITSVHMYLSASNSD